MQTRPRSNIVRASNITAARAIADAVRTSLGPKGMDKMIVGGDGQVTITNDGATIVKKMEVQHAAARMMVDLSSSQDIEAGDGTTSVVVIAGGLLGAAETLLGKGIHPQIVAQSFQKCVAAASEVLVGMATPLDLSDRDSMLKNAVTSLNSKVISQNSHVFAPIAVDAVMKVIDPGSADNVDLRDIKIVKKIGGTVDDTELIEGLVFKQRASLKAGGPTRLAAAKIALIQFCISPPKTDLEHSVVVHDYAAMDRILREEKKYIAGICKKIRASGANVLLIQKSILRDAVTDLSLHYLAKMKIMVVTDIERDEIEFISKTLDCTPIAHVDEMAPEKLGFAELVEDISVAGSKLVKVTGVRNLGKTVTVLVRGSNQLTLDEADRSLHDALCVIRSLVKKKFMIAGGSAGESEISHRLAAMSKEATGIESECMRAYADALEIVPFTLAQNAGLDALKTVTELRNRHAKGESNAGINVRKGTVSDMLEEGVVQPLLVSLSAFNLATECVSMILKIDDLVPCR